MTTQKETPTTVGFKDIVTNEFQNDETKLQQTKCRTVGGGADLASRICGWGKTHKWHKIGAISHRLQFQRDFSNRLHQIAIDIETDGRKLLAGQLADGHQKILRLCDKIDRMCRQGCQTDEELDDFELARTQVQNAIARVADLTHKAGIPIQSIGELEEHPLTEQGLSSPSQTSKAKITEEEANVLIRKRLPQLIQEMGLKTKKEFRKITARLLAEKIGCSLGLVSRCSAWKAFKKTRDCKQETSSKMVRLNAVHLDNLEADDPTAEQVFCDSQLQQLIAEQNSDMLNQNSLQNRAYPGR